MSLAASAWLACAAPAFAESVTLFRVFLNDGTAIVSYGEYARVGDRLVFSMPIGAVDPGNAGNPSLHVVNLPVSAVNWTATEKYAESARHTHYMANSAESDYAALAGDVAATLNAIVLANDAKARLNMAVAARRRLATWPRDHYGYRADDVKEMLGLLDEAISGLRVAAGESSFAIDLVATTPPGDPRDRVPLLRAPSAVEAITHAIAAAKATDIPVDRVSILRGVVAALDDPRNALPAAWARPTRRWALRTIAEEGRIEKTYGALTSTTLKRATAAAGRADVRAVERVLASVVRRDAKLGRKRPEEINALLEQVRVQLDAARRLRLARDQWHERAVELSCVQDGRSAHLECHDASAAEPRRHQATRRIRCRCARRPRRSTRYTRQSPERACRSGRAQARARAAHERREACRDGRQDTKAGGGFG